MIKNYKATLFLVTFDFFYIALLNFADYFSDEAWLWLSDAQHDIWFRFNWILGEWWGALHEPTGKFLRENFFSSVFLSHNPSFLLYVLYVVLCVLQTLVIGIFVQYLFIKCRAGLR